MAMLPDLPPLIAITGPTASGKSDLALRLCRAINGEIVTADSRQVYRLMDIGTDKPTPDQQALVPHHMIDMVFPDQTYTLALYQEDAFAAIESITRRGRIPVLAGGTPLYVNSVLEGWTIPRVEPDTALRLQLEEEADASGSQALHSRLAQLDPTAAGTILPTNTRRIIRALEVTLLTGRPISEQQGKQPPPYRTLSLLLECGREELYRRIDERVGRQVQGGLVDEVAHLHSLGYDFDLPSMSGLGYRQIGAYLQGTATLEEAVQRIKWDTHAFARHQANWFRRAHTAHKIDVASRDPYYEALEEAGALVAGATARYNVQYDPKQSEEREQ